MCVCVDGKASPGSGDRELDAERRALSWTRFDRDVPAVRFRHGGHDREPEPCTAARTRARLVGAVEAFEDVLALFGIQPGTGIGHLETRHRVDETESDASP